MLNEIASLQLASTGHQHEGSVYGARKDYDLARMQVNLVAHQMTALREALSSSTLPDADLNELDSDEEDQDGRPGGADARNENGKIGNGELNNGYHDDDTARVAGRQVNGGSRTNGTADGGSDSKIGEQQRNGHAMRDDESLESNVMMDVNGAFILLYGAIICII